MAHRMSSEARSIPPPPARPPPAAPSSPTLTNPDMILPPQNAVRDTPSPPPPPPTTTTITTATSTTITATANPAVNNAHAHQPSIGRMSSFNAGKRRSVLEKPGLGPRLPIAGTARPSMPGSWQSESDLHDPANTSLSRKTSLSHSHSPSALANNRLSRTGSLRAAAANSWGRTASRERSDNGYSAPPSSLLGPGIRRRTLAERLEEEDPPDSPYTTTSESNAEEDDEENDISSRAEEILANAKKRLTAMEGNLNRARSLSTTRTSSPASSTGEPHVRHSKRVSRSGLTQGNGGGGGGSSWALASSKLRQASLAGGSGHLRVFSETAASNLQQQQQRISTISPQRSSSALGHGAQSPALRGEWTDTSSSDNILTNGHSRYLEPLHEDELYTDELSSQPSQPSPIPQQQASNASIMYQTPSSSTSTLSRARSSIALRDLQEGVGDLQDRVALLNARTKRDNMKRASLQRLKTQSPFTHAEQWSDSRDRESKVSIMSTETAVRITEPTPPQPQEEFDGNHNPGELQEPLSAASSGSVYSTASPFKSPISHFHAQQSTDFGDSPLLPVHPRIRHIPPTPTTPFKGHKATQSTDSNQTTETEPTSEPISPSLSDAFPAPPETTPTPPRSRSNSAARSRSNSAARVNRSRSSSNVSQGGAQGLSHEDNPDAFDYTRFLLDSAMGTYALDEDHQRTRSRSPSSSSTGTQSTTRPGRNGTARLSKTSNASGASRASTAKRISLSPSMGSRTSTGSTGSSQHAKTLAQRRASGRSNSSTSLRSITIPDGRRSASSQRSVSDVNTSPPTTVSPPLKNKSNGTTARPGHTRQLSTDSISTSSVASFATAIERASSQLTIRSMSRNTLRNASAGSNSGNHKHGGSGGSGGSGSSSTGPIPTHRAGLEAYNSSINGSFVSAVSSHSPPDVMRAVNKATSRNTRKQNNTTTDTELLSPTSPATRAMNRLSASIIASVSASSSGASPQSRLSALLMDEADGALRIPSSPTLGTLPSNLSKASTAILSAVMAVSHAAVREDDERRGIAPDLENPRLMTAEDEAMLGRIVEGVLTAAVGLIGRQVDGSSDGDGMYDGEDIEHGTKGNSWRESSRPGRSPDPSGQEIDQDAVEKQRQIIRLRCEVARRALSEEKPGEGF